MAVSQRRALGALFLVLAALLHGHRRTRVLGRRSHRLGHRVAAAGLALWLLALALRALSGTVRAERGLEVGRILCARGAVDDTPGLWLEFSKDKTNKALRDRLILTYAPLVKYVAGRLGSGLPAHVEEGDLVSYGLLGLIGAIERYDPGRDIKFETYAIARIKGAIIDELRAMDWVPRSVRARARHIERAMAELEARLHRAPTDQEIASKLGIEVEELEEA